MRNQRVSRALVCEAFDDGAVRVTLDDRRESYVKSPGIKRVETSIVVSVGKPRGDTPPATASNRGSEGANEAIDIHQKTPRIRADYREMPGLKLTAAQASRFWNLGPDESRPLLDALVEARVLWRTPDGHYVLVADSPAAVTPLTHLNSAGGNTRWRPELRASWSRRWVVTALLQHPASPIRHVLAHVCCGGC